MKGNDFVKKRIFFTSLLKVDEQNKGNYPDRELKNRKD